MRNAEAGGHRWVWIALLGMVLAGATAMLSGVQAEGVRSTVSTKSAASAPDRSGFYSDSAVAVGAGATPVDFTAATAASRGGAFAVQIYNKTAGTDLLAKFIPAGTAVAASQLTTPANKVGTEVQRIEQGESPVTFTGNFAGLVLQSVGPATVSVKVRFIY